MVMLGVGTIWRLAVTRAARASWWQECYNELLVLTKEIGLGTAILGANLRSPSLPYKVTFVATYHCNFRCEMCNIWQKKSVDEMTPAEVEQFFGRYSQFRWVHLTGGELFMRRD